jgi:acyl-[acyl-carrier-protein]-phospholipid O-acyltransferase/long-chain-fatty-acid--[acyl-carrier-protein] ligase
MQDTWKATGVAASGIAGGFGLLLIVRGLTVLNDNLVRWLTIGLGKRAVEAVGSSPDAVRSLGLVFYILPFLLSAWLAGWLADRLAKRSVILGGKLAEVFMALAVAGVVAWGVGSGPRVAGIPLGLWLLLGTIGLFGLQSAVINPSLLGTLPELVSRDRLAAANSWVAIVTLAATMVGMAIGSPLADIAWPAEPSSWAAGVARRLEAFPLGPRLPTAVVVVVVAIAGWGLAVRLPRIPAANPTAAPPWNMFATTVADLRRLLGNRRLAAAATGIVYFWAVGAIVQLTIDVYKDESGSTLQTEGLPLLLALISGIGLGSLIAGRYSNRGIDAGSKVDLGFLPLGGLVMAVACGALALSSEEIFGDPQHRLVGLAGPVFWLAVLGIGAGLFDVPLEAYLQEQSPPERLGSILASTNLLVFLGMLGASILFYGLRMPIETAGDVHPWLSARAIFGLFMLMSLAATAVSIWAAPRASLRFLVGMIVGTIWRFRVRRADCMPEAGPLVVVANHLSWLDGFLLPLAAPRPVRMVVYGPNIRGRFLRMLADQWRFILFDPKPKSIGRALKAIQQGLAAGDCIGIFCEGGISRTGQLLGFKRGLEWLLERVESPLQPAAIDGMWGSLLSFSEGRYFTKRPRGWRRPVTLCFGPPLPVGSAPAVARLALQELAAVAVHERLSTRPEGVAAAATAEAFDGCCLLRRTDRMLVSQMAEDPLAEVFGCRAPQLLGLPGETLNGQQPLGTVLDRLVNIGATVWIARLEQIEALAAGDTAGSLPGSLEVIVMPIGSGSAISRATPAGEQFRKRFGIQPVVAFAPHGCGLLAMHTPPARAASHETTWKAGSVGRVVNGAVVWPQASVRQAAAREPLSRLCVAAADALPPEPEISARSLAIGATIPASEGLGCLCLTDSFDVDEDGFLVLRLDPEG